MKKILSVLVAFMSVITVYADGPRKTVAILGDSYSTYEKYVSPDTNLVWYHAPKHDSTDLNHVSQTWWHKFIKDNGYKLGVNNSYSGATICYTGYRGEDYKLRSFVNRHDDLGNPDVIFIFGGTNDSWAGAPIGEYKYSDWTDEELYSFRPAMSCLLDKMINRYPNVEIYFLLNDGLKDEINESVKTVCGHYGIDCIELKDIDKQNGHPTIKGMSQIADQVKAYLDACSASR